MPCNSMFKNMTAVFKDLFILFIFTMQIYKTKHNLDVFFPWNNKAVPLQIKRN